MISLFVSLFVVGQLETVRPSLRLDAGKHLIVHELRNHCTAPELSCSIDLNLAVKCSMAFNGRNVPFSEND
jgi:hypothetical protein